VVVWGHAALGTFEAPADAITIGFGEDLYAYETAYRTRLILQTAPLPPLRRVDAVSLPIDYRLAALAVAVPVLLSLAWLSFVRRFDRGSPEPLGIVLVTFVLGALAAPVAGVIEAALRRASPFLNPHLTSLGGQLLGAPLTLVVASIVIG